MRAFLVALLVGAAISSCRSPAPSPPGPANVALSMDEYRFQYDRPVPRGRVVFTVRNVGQLTHEVVLTQLGKDFPPIADQLKGSERRFATTIAALPRRAPGEGTVFAIDLAPGRYALLCFVREGDGVPHARKGMSSEFRVS